MALGRFLIVGLLGLTAAALLACGESGAETPETPRPSVLTSFTDPASPQSQVSSADASPVPPSSVMPLPNPPVVSAGLGSQSLEQQPLPGPSAVVDTAAIPGPVTFASTSLVEAVLACFQSTFLTGDRECYGGLIQDSGPGPVMQAVADLIQAGDIDSATDTHSLAHVIGRQTARVLGLNGEAFLRCSTEFNYGCQHGFFEQSLASAPNAAEAASNICADLVGSYSKKTAFYCYHGVGHGIMMASAYDLDRALGICDSLGDPLASEGCWQGVFMENVNAVMRSESREGVFSDEDPLAPCNGMAERHKWQCYINHAGRLITLFDFSVADASHACLAASSRLIQTCIESLGLMVSNPAWQATLAGSSVNSQTTVEVTIELCEQFPDQYRETCAVGAVDNIMNFEGVTLDLAPRFCKAVNQLFRDSCYRHIGLAIGAQIIDPQERLQLCGQIDVHYQEACLQGAGVALVDGRFVDRREESVEIGEQQDNSVPAEASEAGESGALGPDASPDEPTVVVAYLDGAFDPGTVMVSVGDTVRWLNEVDELIWPASDLHPTHQEYTGFDSRRPTALGGGWSFTFHEPGIWSYHNHVDSSITGVIIVEE